MVSIDMEMPSCCAGCPYGHCVGSFSFCSIIGDDEIDIQEDYLAGTRYEYCPLVEIEDVNQLEKLDKIEQIVERFKNQYDHTSNLDLMVEIKEVLEQE